MYEIIFTKEADFNIENLRDYIWENIYFFKVIESIYNTISLLENNPEMWVEIVKLEREIVEPKYKYQIRYAVIWKEIYILFIYKFNNIKWR